MQLYNKLSAEERARIIDENSQERITLSFYKYFKLGNPKVFRDHLFMTWSKLDILGRIYIANEGINAQLSVPKENINEFKETLLDIIPLNKIRLNFALEHYSKSFLKLTIKIRKKIVADGLDDKTFDVTNIGKHLDAENFNKMLNDSNTVCIDMRNHYESEIGFFKGAIKPNVDTFRESLEIIDNELEKNGSERNYLMYCTGGIRCEKASAYLKHNERIKPNGEYVTTALPIKVGDNVWIGGNSSICQGVTIGSNSTIGAGSIVFNDIPNDVLAYGNPCKVIKKL